MRAVFLYHNKVVNRMKIKVKQDFRDRSADLALRKKGEVLDVSEQRAKELIAKGFAAEVKPKQEDKTEQKN